MFQTSVLASGSKGNALLVRSEATSVLLDAGVAAKTIFAALEALRIERHSLQAVIVSHEHSDHVRSVGAISRLLKIPLYINYETYCQCSHRLGRLPVAVQFFETGSSFRIRDLVIHPFSSSHDAADSCNFTFLREGAEDRKLGIATDLGYPTAMAVNKLKHCSTLILESNHDERMLLEGPYPWELKQRIKSINGHLSNLQAVGVVSQVMHHGLRNLVLAHLSETNNDPDLAYQTMLAYLTSIRSDTRLFVAEQHHHTPLLDV